MSCLALPNKTEVKREVPEEPSEFRIGINPMHWTLQKLFESSDKIPQHFTAADRRAVQLKLPVYRYDAGQSIQALAVPVQEFCKASAEIKLVFSGSELAELKNSEWIVFLSREVPLADFEKLITTFNQDKPEGAILKFIAIPVAWQQFQSELKTLAKREYGRLTLKENVSHKFMIWILETPQSALAEPPIDERLVPEGPDYLRGRESWFREKFERHD